MIDGDFLTTAEAARRLGRSSSTILSHISRRRIRPPSLRFGPDYVWTRADVEAARVALATRRPAGRPRNAVPAGAIEE
jgi:excisionase family DNA binding protein